MESPGNGQCLVGMGLGLGLGLGQQQQQQQDVFHQMIWGPSLIGGQGQVVWGPPLWLLSSAPFL